MIGTTIALNQVPFTVVGVEPSGFSGTEVGRPYDVSIPVQASPALNEGRPPLSGAFTTWLYVLARLKPGVTLAAAEQEIEDDFRAGQPRRGDGSIAGDQQLARESPVAAGAGRARRRQRPSRRLRALAEPAADAPRRRPAPRQPERRDAAAVALRRAAAGDRHAPGPRRRARGASSGSSSPNRWCWPRAPARWARDGRRGAAGRCFASPSRRPNASRSMLGPDWRLIAVHARPSPPRPACSSGWCRRFAPRRRGGSSAFARSAAAGSAACSIARWSRRRSRCRWSSWSPPACSCGRSGTCGRRTRATTAHNVLMFSVDPRLAGKNGGRHPADLPARARRAANRSRSAGGHDVRGQAGERQLLLHRLLQRDRRQDAHRRTARPGRVQPCRAGLLRDARASRSSRAGTSTSGMRLDAPKVIIISERLARHFEGNPIGQRLGAGRRRARSRRRRQGHPLRQRQGCAARSGLLPDLPDRGRRTSSTPQRSRSATPAAPRDWSRPFGRSPPASIRV